MTARIVVIDFETYWDNEFSLSKITMEEYIRSPQFEVIGVSVKEDADYIKWYTGKNIKPALDALRLQECIVVAHNAAFDCAILTWIYGIRPGYIVDTLSYARPIIGLKTSCSLRALATWYGIGSKGNEVYNTKGKHLKDFTDEELAKFGEYCKQDVNLTAKLLPDLYNAIPKVERDLVDCTIRMFTEPVIELDTPLLEKHLSEVLEKKAKLLDLVGHDGREAFMSNDKFAALLRAEGVDPPTKVSERTGKTTYAFAKTDDGMRDLLVHPNERVQALAAARLGLKSTIEETRTQSFIDISKRGPMPIQLNYYGAVNTGRYCLTGDTVIHVLRASEGYTPCDISLAALEDEDLVWDGETYVPHEGLLDQGVQDVITYQGITGTPDHRVYVEEINGPCELSEAAERGYTLKAAKAPK